MMFACNQKWNHLVGTKRGTHGRCGDDPLNKRARGLCWDLTFCYCRRFFCLVAISGRVVMRNYRGSIPLFVSRVWESIESAFQERGEHW